MGDSGCRTNVSGYRHFESGRFRMRSMYDDAFPPSHPPGTDAVAFYIGGDTPHPWTDAEILRQSARYRLPIWVRSNPSGAAQGRAEGHVAADWAHAHKQPLGTCIALDLETAINGDYVKAFDSAVRSAGYKTLVYGSAAYCFAAQPVGTDA